MNFLSYLSLGISLMTLCLTLFRDLSNNKKDQSKALITYLDQGDSDIMKQRRRIIYQNKELLKQKDFQDKIIACFEHKLGDPSGENKEIYDLEKLITDLVSFYDKWALLYNKRYLPKWAIEGPRKTTFTNMYGIIYFYVDYRRNKIGDLTYAKDMVLLYNKINKVK